MNTVSEKYFSTSYDFEERFGSFWHQIRAISGNVKFGSTCLEIGPGSGLVTEYLRKRGYIMETMDLDLSCNPTHVGSIEKIPLEESSYDCVVAFEVLEHLSFERLMHCLSEMRRVAKKWVIFSVPNVQWFLSFDIRVFSSSKKFRAVFSFPRLLNRHLKPPKSGEDHYWEIGRPGYSPIKVLAEIENAGLTNIQNFRIPSFPIHHIFLSTTGK